MVLSGLDVLVQSNFTKIKGKRIGVVCNQAAITRDNRHILDVLCHRSDFMVGAILGPQHGLFGHTQDNMIEWEGRPDPRFDAPIFSLYGEQREPTAKMLEGLDLIVIDIQDVGARYYTFQWTMALCIKVCANLNLPVLVLDRPNPINGTQTEGTLLDPHFASFVGLHPVLTRHGLTAGEIAKFANHVDGGKVEVIHCQGWDRHKYGDEQHMTWAMPSPNMPTIDTAVVYPGACLFEGTNLSEGRGTTRPFEIVGAPWLDGWKLAEALNRLHLHGVTFRPIQFEPTFNKYVGKVCEGVFTHVTDRRTFEPVLTSIAIMQESIRQAGYVDSASIGVQKSFVPNSPEMGLKGFAWRQPPYEYEFAHLPIDILAGNAWLRKDIESLTSLLDIREKLAIERNRFESFRREYVHY